MQQASKSRQLICSEYTAEMIEKMLVSANFETAFDMHLLGSILLCLKKLTLHFKVCNFSDFFQAKNSLYSPLSLIYEIISWFMSMK